MVTLAQKRLAAPPPLVRIVVRIGIERRVHRARRPVLQPARPAREARPPPLVARPLSDLRARRGADRARLIGALLHRRIVARPRCRPAPPRPAGACEATPRRRRCPRGAPLADDAVTPPEPRQIGQKARR